MSFWQTRTGNKIDGSDANSFSSNFKSLPDNTVATAMVKSVLLNEYNGEKYYQLIWKLIDGEFESAEVKQRITPYDVDDNKAQRSLNMLMRLFKLSEVKLTHSEEPQDEDLAPMKNKIMCIKIGNGIIQGEERTWVREVHKKGELETCTGNTIVNTARPESQSKVAQQDDLFNDSALSRNKSNPEVDNIDDDIPF